MVEDSGIKQKKLENQLRLDAKVCDLEIMQILTRFFLFD